MSKFNFLEHRTQPTDLSKKVRVVSTGPYPFAGLKGHDYIKAKGLNKPVTRITPKTTT